MRRTDCKFMELKQIRASQLDPWREFLKSDWRKHRAERQIWKERKNSYNKGQRRLILVRSGSSYRQRNRSLTESAQGVGANWELIAALKKQRPQLGIAKFFYQRVFGRREPEPVLGYMHCVLSFYPSFLSSRSSCKESWLVGPEGNNLKGSDLQIGVLYLLLIRTYYIIISIWFVKIGSKFGSIDYRRVDNKRKQTENIVRRCIMTNLQQRNIVRLTAWVS